MKLNIKVNRDPESEKLIERYRANISLYPSVFIDDFDEFVNESNRPGAHPTPMSELCDDGVMRLTDSSKQELTEWLAVKHPGYYTVAYKRRTRDVREEF